jgi:hypothetical protein
MTQRFEQVRLVTILIVHHILHAVQKLKHPFFMKIGGKKVLGRGPSVNIATSYQNCSRVVTVVEGEGLRIVAVTCSARASEGFSSVGLDGSATSGTLQHKTHQYISKIEFKEEKCSSTARSTVRRKFNLSHHLINLRDQIRLPNSDV